MDPLCLVPNQVMITIAREWDEKGNSNRFWQKNSFPNH